MSKLRVGSVVRYRKKYLKWLSENSDECFGYPQRIVSQHTDVGQPSIPEQLCEYFMDRYSYERGLDVHGVIVGDNGCAYDFAYLVWSANELGEELAYISPKNLKVLK